MFNNQYGSYGYGLQQPQQNFNFNPMQPKPNGNFFYINGLAGAQSFFVSQPNTTVLLFDSDSSDFYIKATNQQGQATLRRFEYKEKQLVEPKEEPKQEPKINLEEYVSKKEFEAFKEQLKKPTAQTNQNKGSEVKNG